MGTGIDDLVAYSVALDLIGFRGTKFLHPGAAIGRRNRVRVDSKQGTKRGGHRFLECHLVIPTLEEQGQTTRARSEPVDDSGQLGEVPARESQFAQWVGLMRVESTRNQYPVRCELLNGRSCHTVNGRSNHVPCRTGRQRHIHRQSHCLGPPDLRGLAGAGK